MDKWFRKLISNVSKYCLSLKESRIIKNAKNNYSKSRELFVKKNNVELGRRWDIFQNG